MTRVGFPTQALTLAWVLGWVVATVLMMAMVMMVAMVAWPLRVACVTIRRPRTQRRMTCWLRNEPTHAWQRYW